MEFILPYWMDEEIDIFDSESPSTQWYKSMQYSENSYNRLIENGWTPQQARSVLPNSLKTEIIVKGNAREWMHFFELRCAPTAHPQMREVATKALQMCHKAIPVVFDKLAEKYL